MGSKAIGSWPGADAIGHVLPSTRPAIATRQLSHGLGAVGGRMTQARQRRRPSRLGRGVCPRWEEGPLHPQASWLVAPLEGATRDPGEAARERGHNVHAVDNVDIEARTAGMPALFLFLLPFFFPFPLIHHYL